MTYQLQWKSLLLLLLISCFQSTQSFTAVRVSYHHQKEKQTRNQYNKQLNMSTGGANFLVSNQELLSIEGPIRLILASQSPRRREILDMMGLKGKYTVNPSPLDEEKLALKLSQEETLTPQEYTKTLAEEKANALAVEMVSDGEDLSDKVTFILGSDTIVDLNGKILEKPKSYENAVEMLKSLSGQWHSVHTGVAIYSVDGEKKVQLATSYTETTKVKFSDLSLQDIEAYVKTGEPMDKSGSYGIQVSFSTIIEFNECKNIHTRYFKCSTDDHFKNTTGNWWSVC